jgi:hypothetical protein
MVAAANCSRDKKTGSITLLLHGGSLMARQLIRPVNVIPANTGILGEHWMPDQLRHDRSASSIAGLVIDQAAPSNSHFVKSMGFPQASHLCFF